MKIKKQLRTLYLYEFVSGIRLTDVVWVLLLLTRGFSLLDVGIAEGVFHLVSFLCEVPSGMAADLLGRRRTLMCAGAVQAAGCLVMALCTDLPGICAAMGCNALSYNLASGTREAITYDSLLQGGCAEKYLAVSARQEWICQTTQAMSTLCSVVTLALGYRCAYFLSAGLGLLCLFTAARLGEPAVTAAQARRPQLSLRLIGRHAHQSALFLAQNPRCTGRMLASGLAAAGAYLVQMFLQQHLVDSGVPAGLVGLPLLLIALAFGLGASAARLWRGHFFALALFCGAGTGLAVCVSGLPGLVFCLAGGASAGFFSSLLDVRANAELQQVFPSDSRATLVSVSSMLYSFFMIVLSPLTGAAGTALGAGRGLTALGLFLLVLFPAAGALYRLVFLRKAAANRRR